MIEGSWCEQHDLFYWESLNSQPVALTETDPISLPKDSGPIYIAWEQIFLTTWVMDSYKAQMFSFSAETLSEGHKLLLIKILTIHGKWVLSVNMEGSRSKWCWCRASWEYRAMSESTFEVSCGGKKACGAVSCGITGAHVLLATEKTQLNWPQRWQLILQNSALTNLWKICKWWSLFWTNEYGKY